VVELRCTHDPETCGGNAPDRRKVQATLHWVCAADAVTAEIRLYSQLFAVAEPNPSEFVANLNPHSLKRLADARLEPALANADLGTVMQFERQGYFCLDASSAPPGKLVFNRTVGLRDTWAKGQSGKGASSK
jgi:glutaminyl-tRNA synthetase